MAIWKRLKTQKPVFFEKSEKKLVFFKALCYNPKMTVTVVVRPFFRDTARTPEDRECKKPVFFEKSEKKLVFFKALCYNPKMTVTVVVRPFFRDTARTPEDRECSDL